MVDAHEPLLGRQKDQRILAAPAMRIAMRQFLRMQQRADLAQLCHYRIVRLEDVLSRPLSPIGREHSPGVDRGERLQPVLCAHHEIFIAVTRSGMHQAGAGVCGDVVAEHQTAVTIRERMDEDIFSVERLQRFTVDRHVLFDRQPAGLCRRLGEPCRHDVIFVSRSKRHVVESFVERDSEIRRQRPRRRGPDYRVETARRLRRRQFGSFGCLGCKLRRIAGVAVNPERHVNRR